MLQPIVASLLLLPGRGRAFAGAVLLAALIADSGVSRAECADSDLGCELGTAYTVAENCASEFPNTYKQAVELRDHLYAFETSRIGSFEKAAKDMQGVFDEFPPEIATQFCLDLGAIYSMVISALYRQILHH